MPCAVNLLISKVLIDSYGTTGKVSEKRSPPPASAGMNRRGHTGRCRFQGTRSNIRPERSIESACASHGFTGSYSSVRRFLAGVEAAHPQVTTVLEFDPGEAAQVDFGKGPEVLDPRTGELLGTWIFVMTLAWSRHAYAEVVTDQKVATWLRARLIGGMMNKARRGELRMRLPVGFAYDGADRVILDPDQQVQQAVRVFFETFRRVGSATATVKEFRRLKLRFPRQVQHGSRKGESLWGELEHHRARWVLHHPRYAGVFC